MISCFDVEEDYTESNKPSWTKALVLSYCDGEYFMATFYTRKPIFQQSFLCQNTLKQCVCSCYLPSLSYSSLNLFQISIRQHMFLSKSIHIRIPNLGYSFSPGRLLCRSVLAVFGGTYSACLNGGLSPSPALLYYDEAIRGIPRPIVLYSCTFCQNVSKNKKQRSQNRVPLFGDPLFVGVKS